MTDNKQLSAEEILRNHLDKAFLNYVDKAVANYDNNISQNVFKAIFAAMEEYASQFTPSPIQEGIKFFPVNYGGWWHIQTSPYYEPQNILDEDDVGETEATNYANLICKLLNEYYAKAD